MAGTIYSWIIIKSKNIIFVLSIVEMSSSIQSAVKSVIGGAGASDYVADVAGGLNQQVTQAGSIAASALKPVSAGQAGGRRRGSSRRRHSRQQKKAGGSAAAVSSKKMEGGRRHTRRTRRATSSRKNRK